MVTVCTGIPVALPFEVQACSATFSTSATSGRHGRQYRVRSTRLQQWQEDCRQSLVGGDTADLFVWKGLHTEGWVQHANMVRLPPPLLLQVVALAQYQRRACDGIRSQTLRDRSLR